MKSTYTRDVSPILIEKCKNNKVFGEFIEFVKKSKDLALCFRGNDSEIGTVTIYRHNHMMWLLRINEIGTPIVEVSMNHCRFMSDWDSYAVKGLMDIGFIPLKKELKDYNYDTLVERRALASKSGENDYDVIELEYLIDIAATSEQIKTLVEQSYVILCRMQNEYFKPLKENTVKVVYKEHAKNQPINFVKAYGLGLEDVERKTYINSECESKIYASPQPCVEKHVQQEIFSLNHKLCDGLFVYDLEFEQPKKNGVKLGKSNKPDMFAIRYDSDGNMKAICLVEVKSTITAFSGTSGVKNHMKGMLEYLSYSTEEGLLINDRKREACKILNQYRSLGLYGLSEEMPEYKTEDFEKLETEIIFVFSHGFNLKSYIETEHKTVQRLIAEAKKEQKDFWIDKEINYSDKIDFSVESESIAAYLYRVSIK